MKSPRRTLPFFLSLALLLAGPGRTALLATEAAPAPAASTNANLQEELRMTQQVLEQMRRELDQNAARNAAAITSSLSMLEPTLARLQAQQMQIVQRSNSTILVVAGVFAGVGFLALLLIVVILMRTLGRFSELASATSGSASRGLLPASAGAAPAALAQGDLTHLNPAAVDQASSRFQQAIDHLQKRIFELEHATTPAAPDAARALAAAANISPLPGPGQAADAAARIGLLLGKGQALLNLDQAEQALECFDEILAAEPNHTETLIRRGLALEKLQQWEKALECYDRAIALDHSLTVAFLYKGGVCNKLQRHREALESYEKALHTEKRSRAS